MGALDHPQPWMDKETTNALMEMSEKKWQAVDSAKEKHDRSQADARRETSYTDRIQDYSVDKFYTRGTDANGHDKTVRFNMPPSLLGQMSKAIAEKLFPEYTTIASFCRDAVVHRLVALEELAKSPGFTIQTSVTLALTEAAELNAKYKQEEQYVKELTEILASHDRSMKDKFMVAESYWTIKDTLNENTQRTIDRMVAAAGIPAAASIKRRDSNRNGNGSRDSNGLH